MLQIATVLLHLIGIALWQYTSLPWIHHSEQHVDETSLNFRKQMMPGYNIVSELSEMLLPYNQSIKLHFLFFRTHQGSRRTMTGRMMRMLSLNGTSHSMLL